MSVISSSRKFRANQGKYLGLAAEGTDIKVPIYEFKKKGLIFLVILISLCSYITALKPVTFYSWKPNEIGLIFKEYDFETSDGFVLKAWFYPAQTLRS